ncbi:PAS domain S-box protein [Desulfonatronum parangueonense]
MVRRLGDRLRYLRTLKSMTQAELAQKLDISLRQYNRVERGESLPTISLLERICTVLDSSMAPLFLVSDEGDFLEKPKSNHATCGHSLTGMWALRSMSGPHRWSASLYQLLGYKPFSVKPTVNRFLKHVSPEHQSLFKAFIEDAKKPGETQNQLLRIVTKPSEERFVDLSVDHFIGENCDSEDFYIIVHDITDKILLEISFKYDKKQLAEYVQKANSELESTLKLYKNEISERIETEKSLKIFKLMVEYSNDAQLYVERTGIISFANTAYEKLLNLPKFKIVGEEYKAFISRIRGKSCYDLEIQPCMDKAFLHGEKMCREGWISAESGRRFLSRTYTPCKEGEKVVGVAITIHEITHLRIALDQLAESEVRFRYLLSNVPNVAVQGYRMDGTTFYWNQASEQIYGYSAEEVVDRNLLDLIILPEMREEVETAMRRMAITGEPIPASELWLMRKDGSPVPVYSSHAIVKKEGGPSDLFCIDIDLTERMLAEKAVRDQKTFLRAILDTTWDGFCIVDLGGNFVDVNEAFCRMSGYTREELLKLHITDLNVDETPSEIAARIERIIDNGFDLFEIQHRRSDGTIYTIEASSTWLNRNGGQIVCFLRDITERKQAEAALRLREQLLQIAASANLLLLQGREFGPCITEILAELGHATSTDRAYIFENHREQ